MYKVNFKDRIFDSMGEVKSTRVQIQEDMTTITRVLKGDLGSESDDRLIGLVLEQFYQDTYPNRAENERFEKMDKLMQESNKVLEATRTTLAASVVKEFEYDSYFEDIGCKFEFLANHLGVELPTTNPEDEGGTENGTEGGTKNTPENPPKTEEPPAPEKPKENEEGHENETES